MRLFGNGAKKMGSVFRFDTSASSIKLTDEEKLLFRVMFAPLFYAQQAGLSESTPQNELFYHFIATGLAARISPTPLFEPEVYLEQEGPIDPAFAELPELIRWCRTRYATGIVPTTRFDAEFYLAEYEEVRADGIDPFEHFLRHGLQEGRRPNAVFDPIFYSQVAPKQHRAEEPRLYIHYLTVGVPAGAAPSAVTAPFLTRTSTDRARGLGGYDAVVRALAPWTSAVGMKNAQLLVALCHPYLYDGDGALPATASGVDRLVHFLEEGADAGLDPGPFFDTTYYRKASGMNADSGRGWGANSLLHYLATSPDERIVPNDFFDEQLYRDSWSDLRDGSIWPFGHFLTAGIFEGRRVDGRAREGEHTSPLNSTAGQVRNWHLFWKENGFSEPEPARAEVKTASQPLKTVTLSNFTNMSDRDFTFLKALFVPKWYAEQLDWGSDVSADELFSHYLSIGMDRNLSPSPLFDPAMAAQLLNIHPSDSAMRNWLTRSGTVAQAPTNFLDLEFYKRLYPEFRGVKIDLYDHFVLHGLYEGRTPNAIFDPFWYASAHPKKVDESGVPPYIHFLTTGASEGLCPSRAMLPIYSMNSEGSVPTLDDFRLLVLAFQRNLRKLSAEQCFALIAFFTPHLYNCDEGSVSGSTEGIRRFLHFVDVGLSEGRSPGPMFDSDYYASVRPGRRIFDSHSDAPFLHYLTHAWRKQIVPNMIFDETDYQNRFGDIKASGTWGFQHFLFHGIFEGRQTKAANNFTIAPRDEDLARTQLERWLLFWSGLSELPDSYGMDPSLARQQRRFVEFTKSDVYDEIVRRAQSIDPSLGEPRTIGAAYAAPFHDRLAQAMAVILSRLPEKGYHTIVTVPWLRTGGADLVACQIASAVQGAFSSENVLILRVDEKNFERLDWLPEGVDHVLISDVLNTLTSDQAETLLYSLFLKLQPKRIINVNSLKTWCTFERFGNRLSTKVNLYSYLFCWDQTPEGLRVGYPSMFYAATSPYLAATFTDTDYLRDELLKIYRPPQRIAATTVPLYTPVRSMPPERTMAEISVSRRSGNQRPVVLWAGRLDRQKRFDLVQEIARTMPDIDFLCWGDALLDSPPDLLKSPRNLKLNPGFKDYVELPLEDADLWLFTSAWEGMPTILLELAIRGMAVVASQVGGVPEMADETTSFPVHEINDPEAYVEAIRFALNNPSVRVERAQKFQQRAMQRHSTQTYIRMIKEVFDLECNHD